MTLFDSCFLWQNSLWKISNIELTRPYLVRSDRRQKSRVFDTSLTRSISAADAGSIKTYHHHFALVVFCTVFLFSIINNCKNVHQGAKKRGKTKWDSCLQTIGINKCDRLKLRFSSSVWHDRNLFLSYDKIRFLSPELEVKQIKILHSLSTHQILYAL